MNHDTARALTAVHDMRLRLERVGVEPAWVAVPITLAEPLGVDPSTSNFTLFGMSVMWVDADHPYVVVRV